MSTNSNESGGGRSANGALGLVATFIGAAGFAACLTGVYMAMRDLMINSGGACASGGPYAINPDQVCSTGQTALLMGGIVGGLVFAGILVYGSEKFTGSYMGVGLLLWAALFGALGWNFIELGLNPPESLSSGATGWIISGVVFWLMAIPGLLLGLKNVVDYFKTSANPEAAKPIFDAPIVRANVVFERNMPGDPMFGESDPSRMSGPPASEQAPEQRIESTNDFIDPVTGERTGGNDG